MIKQAVFSFEPGLEFFLQPNQRGRSVVVSFQGRQSIKHLVESLGIPHTEIGRILINGQPGGPDTITRDGDKVEVYSVRPHLPEKASFVLDAHLGKLTARLRMLGFNCLYKNDYQDPDLVEIAVSQGRILLTRDRRLLMRKGVSRGYCLRSLDPKEQMNEIISRFKLSGEITPFRRCMRCNHLLEPVEKEQIIDRLEPLTRKYFNDFRICPACQQVYWKGSHYRAMLETISRSGL